MQIFCLIDVGKVFKNGGVGVSSIYFLVFSLIISLSIVFLDLIYINFYILVFMIIRLYFLFVDYILYFTFFILLILVFCIIISSILNKNKFLVSVY